MTDTKGKPHTSAVQSTGSNLTGRGTRGESFETKTSKGMVQSTPKKGHPGEVVTTTKGGGSTYYAEPKVPSLCKIDIIVLSAFGLLLFVLLSLAYEFDGDDPIPSNIQTLFLGKDNNITENIGINQVLFYDITLPVSEMIIIYISNTFNEDEFSFIDTSLKLLQRPNTIIEFNDDNGLESSNPILYIPNDIEQDFVIQVDTFTVFKGEDKSVTEGSYTLSAEIVENIIRPDIAAEVFLGADAFHVAKLELEAGVTYEITAYLNPSEISEYYDFTEADTAIRIRDANGEEVIEVTGATLSEFTARVTFTPPSTEGLFFIEVKVFDRREKKIIILARTVEPEVVNLTDQDELEISHFPLHSQVSTILEFDVVENLTYDVKLTLDLNETFAEDIIKLFGYIYYNDAFTALYTYFPGVIPGVSLRFYDKEENEIIQRERTEIIVSERTEPTEVDSYYRDRTEDYVYFYETVSFTSVANTTDFTIVADKNRTILMEISRWDVDLSFIDVDDILQDFLFGSFSLEVEVSQSQENVSNQDENNRVDPLNLFPDCDIDATTYTIADDTCEQGIALYCRDEFAPSNDLSLASLGDFKDVCDCVTYLCATLQSGDDLDDRIEQLLVISSVFFGILSITGMLIYLLAHLELFLNGGFQYWVENNKGFSSWTLIFCFLLASAIFNITELTLAQELVSIQNISRNFDIFTIPIPAEQFTFRYYYARREEILGGGYFDGNRYQDQSEQGLFLQGTSAQIAAGMPSFQSLQHITNLNLFCSVLKNVLGIMVFLDVSYVWLSSTASARLNRLAAIRQERKLKRLVRFSEIFYSVVLLFLLLLLVSSNGSEYNILPNILTLLASLLIIFIYFISRSRVGRRFAASQILTSNETNNLWLTIRNVSSVVIIGNIGIACVQVYSIVNIQSFDELVEEGNDSVTQVLLLFQDICMFTAVGAVLVYVFREYFNYRETLFTRTTTTGSVVLSTEVAPTSYSTKVKLLRMNVPSPESLKGPGAIVPSAFSEDKFSH